MKRPAHLSDLACAKALKRTTANLVGYVERNNLQPKKIWRVKAVGRHISKQEVR